MHFGGCDSQTILRADHVAYKIKPVSGYDDLERANEELVRGNSEVCSPQRSRDCPAFNSSPKCAAALHCAHQLCGIGASDGAV